MPEKGRRLVAAAAKLLIEAGGLIESSETIPLKAEILNDINKATAKAKDLAGDDDDQE